jgi:hypothetical protein
MKALRRITCVCVASCVVVSVAAQPAPPKAAKQASKTLSSPPAPRVMKLDIDLAAEQLPTAFDGHGAIQVADGLEKLGAIEKGEFESTGEFASRKASLIERPYADQLSVSDLHYFVIPIKKMEGLLVSGIVYKYDADSEIASLYVLPHKTRPNGIGGKATSLPSMERFRERKNEPWLDQFPLARTDLGTRTYDASNAYGAKVIVTAYSSSAVQIGSGQLRFLPQQSNTVSLNREYAAAATLHVPRAKAAEELASWHAILVAKPVEPFIEYNFVSIEATRTTPTEITTRERIIRADINNIIVFSKSTGRVVFRLPS